MMLIIKWIIFLMLLVCFITYIIGFIIGINKKAIQGGEIFTNLLIVIFFVFLLIFIGGP